MRPNEAPSNQDEPVPFPPRCPIRVPSVGRNQRCLGKLRWVLSDLLLSVLSMARDWETWLKNATGPASTTEEADRDRTVKRIRDAINADTRLAGNVDVFVKGSYANSTNVRRDSDVDVAVEWKTWWYLSKVNDAANLSWDKLGVTTSDAGKLGPTDAEYRRWVEEALDAVFGSSNVDKSGTKHITVTGGSTTLDADVVPSFRHHCYYGRNDYRKGSQLRPVGRSHVNNWPQQCYDNGVSKNTATTRRYKQIIRAVKRLENDMVEVGRLQSPVHGYFVECLLYNLPNATFQASSYKETVLDVLARLWNEINDDKHGDWVEVNGLKWLWRSGQTWTAQEASNFAYKGWNYIKGN